MLWPESDRKLTCAVLRAAAARRNIPLPSRVKRSDLLTTLRQHDSARRIQRVYRKIPHACNSECPITLEPLPPAGRRFMYMSPSGRPVAYSATALAEYISTSGDTRDPVTRQPYTDEEIAQIAHKAGLETISIPEPLTSDSEDELGEGMEEAAHALGNDLRAVFAQEDEGRRSEYMVLHFAPMLHMLAEMSRESGPTTYERFASHVRAAASEVVVRQTPERALLDSVVRVGLGDSDARAVAEREIVFVSPSHGEASGDER